MGILAILVPSDKLDCFDTQRKKFVLDKNNPALYLGPVLPPRADGSPMLINSKFQRII